MVRAEEREQIVLPQVIEASLVTLAQGAEKNVLSHVGQLNACDVWFKVAPDWEPVVTLKLFGRIAGGRVLLATKKLDETHRFTDDGYTSGLAFSLRGRPLEGLELNAICSDGSLANGQFMLSTWTGSEAPSFSAGTLDASTGVSRVEITDWAVGVAPEVTVSNWPGAFSGAGAPVYTRPARAERPTYSVTSLNIAQTSTTNGAVAWLLSLFKPSNATRTEIHRITIAYHGGTTGHVSIQGHRTSTTAATTPPTSRTIVALDSSQSPSVLSAVSGTFTTSPTISPATNELFRFAAKADRNAVFEWSSADVGKPIVLREGQAEGIAIRLVNEMALGAANSVVAAATVHWVEI